MNKRTFVLIISLVVLAAPLARSAGARVGLPAAQGSPDLPMANTPPASEVDLEPANAEAALALMTTRVSVSSTGAEGNNESNYPTLSYDGRYVVFESLASNLVPNDNNADYDVFIHDRQTGQTQRVSVNSSGQEGNGKSWSPVISYTGRYVAFSSFASNLVSNDTNNGSDIFVMDRDTGSIQRVSLSSSEAQANCGSHDPAISSNGRYIAFYSCAGNLVSDDTNGKQDVFVRDVVAGDTWRVSISTNGAQGNDNSWGKVNISSDGHRVSFGSWASTLVAGDTNNTSDAFVRDWYSGWTDIASVSSEGVIGNGFSDGMISGNGRYVVLGSDASNLVSGDTNGHKDTFVHDLDTGLTERVSISYSGQQANYNAGAAVISTDGRLVMFHSGASNLVSGDTNGHEDVFVHDRYTHRTSRVSIATNGTQGNANSLYLLSFSGDSRFVAFSSSASNLVANDGNGVLDVFVREFKPCYALTLQKQSGEGNPPQATPAQSIGCEPGTYNPGETITLTAKPAVGWHVSSWEGTNNDSSVALDNISTMPSNDHTVRVNYAADCYTLNRNVNPDNSGSINPDPQKSPSCPATYQYTYGTSVSLTATPNTGYTFANWSGALSGNQATRNLTIDGNKSVTANFNPICYTLTRNVNPDLGGNITPNLLKSPDCSANYQYTYGTSVSLTATPNTGYTFAYWSGALSGTQNPQNLTMDSNKSVTAHFSPICYTLNLNVQPSDSGDVTPDPTKSASCPADNQYTYGTSVSLTATPDPGYRFANWSGDLTGAQNPKSLTMDGDKSVTAHFSPICYTLNRNAQPNNGGNIAPNLPKSPDCPDDNQYTYGTVVSLTATPNTDYEFDGWSGALTGAQNPQNLTIDGNKNVTAHFSDVNAGCYRLYFDHTGSGTDPNPSSLQSSGCSANFYRSEAIVQVTADPDNGWHVAGWSGTDNDSSTSTTNTVTMPAEEHTVSVIYERDSLTNSRIFLPSVLQVPLTCWPGPNESEPNNDANQSNGPLCSGQTYTARPDDEFDYYYFNTTGTQPLAIHMANHAYPRVQLLLYYQRPSGEPVERDNDPRDGWHITHNGPAGSYYVVIYSDQSPPSVASYTLQATFAVVR